MTVEFMRSRSKRKRRASGRRSARRKAISKLSLDKEDGENMAQNVIDQIKSDLQSNKILIYMKGTPEAPQCGFSAATVQLFKSFGVPFATRDVIANAEIGRAH